MAQVGNKEHNLVLRGAERSTDHNLLGVWLDQVMGKVAEGGHLTSGVKQLCGMWSPTHSHAVLVNSTASCKWQQH